MKIQNLVIAAAVAFIANAGIAKDRPSTDQKQKFAGVVAVKIADEAKVKAFALPLSQQALADKAKEVAKKIKAGEIAEDSTEALDVAKEIRVAVGVEAAVEGDKAQAVEGVKLVAISDDGSSRVATESGKSQQACWRGGFYGYGVAYGGYCGYTPYFNYGGCFGGYYGGNCGGYYGGFGTINYYGYGYGYGGGFGGCGLYW